jgi:hypothetical protein
MTDINLRFRGRDLYGSASFLAFAADADDSLLAGETDGLAVDFTDTDDFILPTWEMVSVQERNSSVDTLQSPHVFFTQSGTSPKYVKASSTTIGWSPHNVILRSEEFDDAVWDRNTNSTTVSANATTAPDGASTADKLVESSGGSFHIIRQLSQNVTATSSIFTVSCYAKAAERTRIAFSTSDEAQANGIDIVYDLSGGQIGVTAAAFGSGFTRLTESIVSVGSGWYRCIVTVNNTVDNRIYHRILTDNGSGTGAISHNYSGDGSSGVYLWGAQVNRGFVATAYMATTSAVRIGLPISYGEGLLAEPAATNLQIQSQTLDVTWTSPGSAVSANAVTAPDGTTTADTITMDSGGPAEHGMASAIMTTVASSIYTTSAYLKAGTSSLAILVRGGNTDGTHWVAACADLSNGTITQTSNGVSASNVSSAITSVGNGWYRVSITGSFGNTDPSVVIYGTDDSTPSFGSFGAHTWTAAGTETIHAWGVQTELGTVATSYIPTVAATATRAEDNILVATSAFPYSATNSTVYVDAVTRVTSVQHNYLAFDNGNVNGQNTLYMNASADLLIFANDDAGAAQANLDSTVNATANTRFQATGVWKANDFAISVDGAAVQTDTSGTMATIDTLRFNDSTPTHNLNGFMRRLVYAPRRVSDGDLPTWRYNF